MKRSARFPWPVILLLAASTLLMLAFSMENEGSDTCISADPVLETPGNSASDLLFELLPGNIFSHAKF